MSKIYFTSDLHLCHKKEFLWGGRGFTSVEHMNYAILNKWNDLITDEDEVYILGDSILSDTERGIEILKQLKGKKYYIYGNHDTNDRIAALQEACPEITFLGWSYMLRINKRQFYLSHFPTITRTLDDAPNKQGVINLYGHTHQDTNFYDGNPYMYHIGMDSHNLTPVSLEEIIEDINKRKDEINKEIYKKGE